jgi:hypothetical protein
VKKDHYLRKLKERAKDSRVYQKHQLDGLEIAQILGDEKHKSLYIKLAKEYNANELRSIARSVKENENIKNRGGYFMTIITRMKEQQKNNHGKRKRSALRARKPERRSSTQKAN